MNIFIIGYLLGSATGAGLALALRQLLVERRKDREICRRIEENRNYKPGQLAGSQI